MVWGGADVLRGFVEVVKWPIERAIWGVERGIVWPLEERTGDWNAPVRAFGVLALALLAVGAGVLGLVWASGSGGGASAPTQTSAPVAAPVVRQAPQAAAVAAAPALRGAKPDFTEAPRGSASKSSAEVAGAKSGVAGAGAESAATTTGSTAEVTKPASSSPSGSGTVAVKPAGPPAATVARRFAGAFVLYEIGRKTSEVKTTFNQTATPRLAHELLRRPPRQPAGLEVPEAKVLNVVAGPHQGDTFTLSVSLLRVGVTSELRLEMQRDPKTGVWQVADSLG